MARNVGSILFDHSEVYAHVLRTVGVVVRYRCYYSNHGFFGGVISGPVGAQGLSDTAATLREYFYPAA